MEFVARQPDSSERIVHQQLYPTDFVGFPTMDGVPMRRACVNDTVLMVWSTKTNKQTFATLPASNHGFLFAMDLYDEETTK
jgi:hypothetical protein